MDNYNLYLYPLQNLAVDCSCDATFDAQLWSKEKLSWNSKPAELRFPNYFSMITGCAVAISKYKVVFIGGHHTIKAFTITPDGEHYPIQKPINNQVIEYNFEIHAWNKLSDILYFEASKL